MDIFIVQTAPKIVGKKSILTCVHSSLSIILKRKRKLVALLLLSYRCVVTINVLWLILAVRWVGLQCVIVVFPDHTHLLFDSESRTNHLVMLNLVDNGI